MKIAGKEIKRREKYDKIKKEKSDGWKLREEKDKKEKSMTK